MGLGVGGALGVSWEGSGTGNEVEGGGRKEEGFELGGGVAVPSKGIIIKEITRAVSFGLLVCWIHVAMRQNKAR